jgi:hypothetical protein
VGSSVRSDKVTMSSGDLSTTVVDLSRAQAWVLSSALRRPQAERHRAQNERDTQEHATGRIIVCREDGQGATERGDDGKWRERRDTIS